MKFIVKFSVFRNIIILLYYFNVEANRAPISCIRCHNAKKHGRFKCGRCGNLYSVSLLYKATGKAASTSKQTQGAVDKSHDGQ